MHTATQSLITQSRKLSAMEFQRLTEVPPEIQWLANLGNDKTRRAYRVDIQSFLEFSGIADSMELREVRRSHVLAWRAAMEKQQLSCATIRRRMSALASLFEYLCDISVATHNPVRGVKRPRVEYLQGKTPALSNDQARALLEAPDSSTLKGIRDRAVLAVLLHHGLRCEELCKLKVSEFGNLRRGIPHLLVHGKGGKVRFLPIHPESNSLVKTYLAKAGHGVDAEGPLFRSASSAQKSVANGGLTPSGIYTNVVKHYMKMLGIEGELMGPHALRCTAATCALDNKADIAQVQEWLGHSNISTTRLYDRRKMLAADSPTFKISY